MPTIKPIARMLLVVLFPLLFGAERVHADAFGSGTDAFEIDFVTVGEPGNTPDQNDEYGAFGAVSNSYRISKFEITEDMINKANSAANLGITHDNRGAHKPVTSVNWFDAAKFINWLNTSSGSPPAYNFQILYDEQGGTITEDGVISYGQPSDSGYNPANLARNSLARYFLPTTDEWYKAAYYSPTTHTYYRYPTGSNSVPDGIDFFGDTSFDAVFNDGAYNSEPNDVDNAGIPSPFGTVGQGGNVWELEETYIGQPFARGGAWLFDQHSLDSINSRGTVSLLSRTDYLGFRVASVIPESNTLVLVAIAFFCKLTRCRHRLS